MIQYQKGPSCLVAEFALKLLEAEQRRVPSGTANTVATTLLLTKLSSGLGVFYTLGVLPEDQHLCINVSILF